MSKTAIYPRKSRKFLFWFGPLPCLTLYRRPSILLKWQVEGEGGRGFLKGFRVWGLGFRVWGLGFRAGSWGGGGGGCKAHKDLKGEGLSPQNPVRSPLNPQTLTLKPLSFGLP